MPNFYVCYAFNLQEIRAKIVCINFRSVALSVFVAASCMLLFTFFVALTRARYEKDEKFSPFFRDLSPSHLNNLMEFRIESFSIRPIFMEKKYRGKYEAALFAGRMFVSF